MLDIKFIKQYLRKDPPKHGLYNETLHINRTLCVHSKGEMPTDLLEKARPNEEQIYKDWRLKRWTPKTKTYWGKAVFNSSKVRKAEDWSVVFKHDIQGAIKDGEQLKKYTEENYPFFDSYDNWFFSFAFPRMFDDPNSVIAVLPIPKNDPNDDTEYLRPFTYLFESASVIDFVSSQYAVLLSDEKSEVLDGDQTVHEGLIYIFIDNESFIIAKQTGIKEQYNFEIATDEVGNPAVVKHDIGHLPAFKIGGLVKDFCSNEILWDSFLEGCVAGFDEAVMDYSDHQVNKAIHLHPDRWEIADQECRSCKGSGVLNFGKGKDGYQDTCKKCNGLGKISVKSPFNTKFIKPSTQDGVNTFTAIPTPPMGYANRPIESLKALKEEYKDDLREGLSAINMEFLMDEPLENSGVSKAQDREPLSNYYYSLGKHCVQNVFIPSYYFISKWRYPFLTEDEIDHNMPVIKVPEKYDMVIGSILSARVKEAKDANMDTEITDNLQIAYAIKEFGDGSNTPTIMKTIFQHDPLRGITPEEKANAQMTGGCTKAQYILSTQIHAFTQRAMLEHDDFLTKDYKGKKDIYQSYTQEVIDEQKKNAIPYSPVGGANA